MPFHQVSLSLYCFVLLLGRIEGINQTFVVDMSVLGLTTTSPMQKTSTTSMPPSSTISLSPVESSTSTQAPSSESVSETAEKEEESVDSSSMFSTSMAPPHPTPSGQELLEELLVTTTVPPAAVTEETKEDDATVATTDFDIDFKSENDTRVESVLRGDTFPVPGATSQYTLGLDATTVPGTEPLSWPTEEPDDPEVIQVGTVRPDVLLEQAPPSTQPMFAVGKTEETIVEPGVTTEMTGLYDTHTTDTTEATSEELVTFPDSTTTIPETDWTTPQDYNPFDDIGTEIPVEGLPPLQPTVQAVQEELSATTPDGEGPSTTESDTFMCNTQPGTEGDIVATTTPLPLRVTSKRPHSEHATASPAIVDGEPSSEDQVTSGSSVQVFDESETQIPDSSTRVQPGDEETATAIEAEYLTPSARAAAVGLPTRPAGPAVPEGPTAQVTTEKQKQELDAG